MCCIRTLFTLCKIQTPGSSLLLSAAISMWRWKPLRPSTGLTAGSVWLGKRSSRGTTRYNFPLNICRSELTSNDCRSWRRLTKAYQQMKNFDKLSFLYLATGSTDKLSKTQKIADARGDPMSRFHNALYAGDILGRIAVMRDVALCKTFLHPSCTRWINRMPKIPWPISPQDERSG